MIQRWQGLAGIVPYRVEARQTAEVANVGSNLFAKAIISHKATYNHKMSAAESVQGAVLSLIIVHTTAQ